MSIKVVITDDEQHGRDAIEKELAQVDTFEVVGRATHGAEAIALVDAIKPDVVFLDIDMPVMTGLEAARVLAQLPSPPLIIFVTAHDTHAIEAFQLKAIDYLLKPFDSERFRQTCTTIEGLMTNRQKRDAQLHSLLSFLDDKKGKKISCYKRGKKDKYLIDTHDVLYIYVENTETYVVTDAEEYLTSMNLKTVFSLLDPQLFFQAHRAYIVNMDKIKKISPLFSGNYSILMNDAKGSKIPLSRIQARELKKRIPF